MTKFSAVVAIGLLCASAIQSRAEGPAPASFTVISSVFGQLVRIAIPAGFVAIHENTEDTFYIREAVLKGETANQWSQMITVTGARGLAGSANFS